MSTLRFTNASHWVAIEEHLREASGERFAFAFAQVIGSGPGGPALEVVGVALIRDDEIEADATGWSISDVTLDRLHNQAAAAGHALIEIHNHRAGPPGFSSIDKKALGPMAHYAVELLGVPYGAAVYAQGRVHAEWWRQQSDGGLEQGEFASVLVYGNQLRVLNARPVRDDRFDRQRTLLGPDAQDAIGALRVAVVGNGGTGSHVVLQLAYLGFRHLLVMDDDVVELTNLNRLVTADHADLGAPKNLVAKRRMQAIDPTCDVQALPGITPSGEHPELSEVDLILGCVDHDGPRHRLNRIAIETRTPYFDIATGVDDSSDPIAVGGRVILVRPGRPCLTCLGELDSAEVGRWGKSPEQQRLDRMHGYGTGVPNPSVVYLNGLAVSASLAELAAWLSGARPPAEWLDIDLVGPSGQPGTGIGPVEIGNARPDCVDCGPA